MNTPIAFLNTKVNKIFNEKHKIENEFLKAGYANGYVAVPPEHPFFEKDYDKVDDEISIHGGLTFSSPTDSISDWDKIEIIDSDVKTLPSGWWVFGFDTLHLNDSLATWPRERCIAETLCLKSQLEEIANIKTSRP